MSLLNAHVRAPARLRPSYGYGHGHGYGHGYGCYGSSSRPPLPPPKSAAEDSVPEAEALLLDSIGYSRFDAGDFVILEKLGEIGFGEDAPTTVFVGGGSTIRLYAARLNPQRAAYESGDQASQTLVLREHTGSAKELGVREWASYHHMGLDSFQPAPRNSDPLGFGAVVGAFVTQTVGEEDDEEALSVWTVTRLADLDKDALSIASEMARRGFPPPKVAGVFRSIAGGATKALLSTHQAGLAHGGIDCSAVAVTRGDITNDNEMRAIASGLANFGYAARLGVEKETQARPFLTAAKLAAAAGRRGLDRDSVLAGVVARREDMRRLGVALTEILLACFGVDDLRWALDGSAASSSSSPSGVSRTLGQLFPLESGKEAWLAFKAKARASAGGAGPLAGFCEVLDAEDGAGWEFVELLLGMDAGSNPLLQLTRAEGHRFINS